MTSSANILAPPYHVQSTAKETCDGFPCFSHHGSVSALWARKWRKPCAAGIYPFTDADVADFDPIFEELVKWSNDDADVLYRPDDYARPFFPIAQQLVSQAEAAATKGDNDDARNLFLRAAAVYRIARFPINRSPLTQEAWEKGKALTKKAAGCSTRQACRWRSPSIMPTRQPATATAPSQPTCACLGARSRQAGGRSCSSSAGSTRTGPTTRRGPSGTSTMAMPR